MMEATWATTDARQIASFESIQENLDQFSKAELRCVDTWISLSCKQKKMKSLSLLQLFALSWRVCIYC